MCTILRSQKLRGRDVVQALVCKQFRDMLRESASEWIHPMFYLQSSIYTVKYKCVPNCNVVMSRRCLYDDNPPKAICCGPCRDTQFEMYVQNGEDSEDYKFAWHRQNNKLRRNPNVLYGYGHRPGKNPYFNDMDPVEGGKYKLPKRLPKSVSLYLK